MLFGYGLAPDNGCENKDRTCPILCGMQCCCGQLKCRQQSAPANKMVFHTELSVMNEMNALVSNRANIRTMQLSVYYDWDDCYIGEEGLG